MMRFLGQNGQPAATTMQAMKRAVALLVLVVVVLALAAQTEAGDSDIEDTSAVAYWSGMDLVAPTGADGDFTPSPVLRVSGNGRMMLAFSFLNGDVQNPYYSLYNRSAGRWGAPQPIYQSSGDLRYVTFAFDSANRAHAVWRNEQDVFYAIESSWPTASKRLPSNSQRIVDAPAIAIGPDNTLHVVWTQGDNLMSVYHAYSRDGGSSWTLSPVISAAGHDTSAADVAVTAEGSVHVVWEEATFDATLPDLYRFQIYYRKGTLQGSSYSWGSTTLLSSTLTGAIRPTLTAEGNGLHLGFTNQVSQDEQYAYYRRFSAGGSWGSLVNINPRDAVSVNTSNPYFLKVSLALCGGDVHIFYHGATDEVNEQIWSATSANNWQTVSAVTPYGTRYIHPSIACSNSVLALGVEQVGAQGAAHDVYAVNEQKRSLLPIIRGGG